MGSVRDQHPDSRRRRQEGCLSPPHGDTARWQHLHARKWALPTYESEHLDLGCPSFQDSEKQCPVSLPVCTSLLL